MSGGNLGPVKEGSYVHVTCSSAGGRPHPVISWWKTGKKLEGFVRQTRDSVDEYRSEVDIDNDIVEEPSASKSVDEIVRNVNGITKDKLPDAENKTAHKTTRSSGTARLETTTDSLLTHSVARFPTPLLKDGVPPSLNKSAQTTVSNTITLMASRELLHTPIICQASVVSPAADISLPSKTTAVVLNITRKLFKVVHFYM